MLTQIFQREIDAAIEGLALEALGIAHAHSQGTETYASLAAKDHPFAKRHSRPGIDSSIVNRHTGVFDASWHVVKVAPGRYQLVNDAPYADFVDQGTSIMHPHTVREAIERSVSGQGAKGLPARLISQHLGMAHIRRPLVF